MTPQRIQSETHQRVAEAGRRDRRQPPEQVGQPVPHRPQNALVLGGAMFVVLWPDGENVVDWCWDMAAARELATLMYEPPDDVSELRGHDLACWCPPGAACHADKLLIAANSRVVSGAST